MMNNKYIMLDYKEYLDLERTKIYHEENIKLLEGMTIIPNEDYEEYKTLQARITRAIEYIDEKCCYNEKTKECYIDLIYDDVPKLIEILGGKDE